MFDTATYIRRRNELKKLVKEGIIILFGNNESPANFPNNGYYPFRQDSSCITLDFSGMVLSVSLILTMIKTSWLAMISTLKTSYGTAQWRV